LAKIGRSAARELFLTGARFPALRAREIGLVHAVVPVAELDAAVDGYVREILTAGPEAVAAAKALIPDVWRRTVDDATAITAAAIAPRHVSPAGVSRRKARKVRALFWRSARPPGPSRAHDPAAPGSESRGDRGPHHSRVSRARHRERRRVLGGGR